MKYTSRENINLIKRMELDLDLLKDETYGLDARHVWEASRYYLWIYLNKKLSVHEQANTSAERIWQMSLFAVVCYACRFFYSAFIKSWIWAPKGRNWLIFRHSRRREYSLGGYEDVYTDDLIDEIGPEHCVVLDKPYLQQHYNPERHSGFHIEFLSLVFRFIKFFVRPRYDSIAINKMADKIQMYLEESITKKIDMREILAAQAARFFVQYTGYLFLLQWLMPQKILLVVSYFSEPLILAASRLQIPTVELQHCVVTSGHLGYSVPTGMTKKSFPDYLLLFGAYWKQSTSNLPLPPERLIILGYPYFERVSTENSKIERRKDQIVIISQGTIGKELVKFAVRLAFLKKGNHKIFFKLHPGERDRARKMYPELYEAKKQGLLEIVDTDTPALYTLFSQSYWQIGVYSTALFEGIALGCQTILVDLPGVEIMGLLSKKGYAQLVRTPEEIQFEIEEKNTVSRNELFAQDWRSNWKQFESMNLYCRFSDDVVYK